MKIPLQWAAVAAGGSLTAIGALWAYASHERHQAAVARSERDAARSEADMREAETEAVVKYQDRVTVIRETAAPIIQQIEEAEGGETPVPEDVLAVWRAGIERVRNPSNGDTDSPADQ